MPTRIFRATKVAEVVVVSWIVKLLTTGMPEAGADFLGTVSIPFAAPIGIGEFFVVRWLPLRAGEWRLPP